MRTSTPFALLFAAVSMLTSACASEAGSEPVESVSQRIAACGFPEMTTAICDRTAALGSCTELRSEEIDLDEAREVVRGERWSVSSRRRTALAKATCLVSVRWRNSRVSYGCTSTMRAMCSRTTQSQTLLARTSTKGLGAPHSDSMRRQTLTHVATAIERPPHHHRRTRRLFRGELLPQPARWGSPRPVPPLSPREVTKRRNRRFRICGGHFARIGHHHRDVASSVKTKTRGGAGPRPWVKALLMRLSMARASHRRSPRTRLGPEHSSKSTMPREALASMLERMMALTVDLALGSRCHARRVGQATATPKGWPRYDSSLPRMRLTKRSASSALCQGSIVPAPRPTLGSRLRGSSARWERSAAKLST